MVEIGGKPILWHIMKTYSKYGFNDFVILCGYKGHVIKEFFANYYLNSSSVCFDLQKNTMETVESEVEPWRVTLLDTGANTMTGGRIKRAQSVVGNEPFLLTYGDGVSDVDIQATIESHRKSNRLVTMTAVQPAGRFGALEFGEDDQITAFKEKPKGEVGWINGGFFVCEAKVFDYITEGDSTIFERAPLERLAIENQMNCYRHKGFWKCMDTLSDKESLEGMIQKGDAKWMNW